MKKIKLEVLESGSGLSVYMDDHRIGGKKPLVCNSLELKCFIDIEELKKIIKEAEEKNDKKRIN